MDPITRRDFLIKAGVCALTPYLVLDAAAARASGRHSRPREARFNPKRPPEWAFPQSIASGDPTPTGVVLWTRVNPLLWREDRVLVFEVALDPSFRRRVLQGQTQGPDFGPESDHTAHIDLDGKLEPGRVYYYRFVYQNTASRTGRCRTLPQPGASIAKLKLGVVTCNDYTNGYFGAFSHIAVDSSIDFVLHLGDFIYETTGGTEFQALPFPDRAILLPSLANRAMNLADFRTLYRSYRSDRWLQLAMEYHTWIVIWDDHEVSNDCYWDYARDTLGAPDHPYQVSPDYGNDAGLLRRLKLDSQRAWAEYVPTRLAFDRGATHPHDALSIYRSVRFGDLVDLYLTDQRTYRMEHPCGEGFYGQRYGARECPGKDDPAATMLGLAQRDWFVGGVTSSPALWKAWGNEVFAGELKLGPSDRGPVVVTVDAWDGFTGERRYIMDALRQAGTRNFTALTGDLHSYIVAYLKADYANRDNSNTANRAGVEFMTPAVTSSNFTEMFGVTPPRPPNVGFPVARQPTYYLEDLARATNPHIQFFNSQDHGYCTVEYTRSGCEYVAYRVDKSVNAFCPAREVIRRMRAEPGTGELTSLPF